MCPRSFFSGHLLCSSRVGRSIEGERERERVYTIGIFVSDRESRLGYIYSFSREKKSEGNIFAGARGVG